MLVEPTAGQPSTPKQWLLAFSPTVPAVLWLILRFAFPRLFLAHVGWFVALTVAATVLLVVFVYRRAGPRRKAGTAAAIVVLLLMGANWWAAPLASDLGRVKEGLPLADGDVLWERVSGHGFVLWPKCFDICPWAGAHLRIPGVPNATLFAEATASALRQDGWSDVQLSGPQDLPPVADDYATRSSYQGDVCRPSCILLRGVDGHFSVSLHVSPPDANETVLVDLYLDWS